VAASYNQNQGQIRPMGTTLAKPCKASGSYQINATSPSGFSIFSFLSSYWHKMANSARDQEVFMARRLDKEQEIPSCQLVYFSSP
jgi:hypothetical protein